MKLNTIAVIGLLLTLAGTAAAQTVRAELPAPDSFLGIATL
jgi:hypothetical protein